VSLAEIAIEKRSVTYFAVLLLFVGGIGSFFSLGQLEDPEYTVKSASITTTYPGASPEEVELEVTDRALSSGPFDHQGRHPAGVLVRSTSAGLGRAPQEDPRYRAHAAPGRR
jgi:hypothetical protein